MRKENKNYWWNTLTLFKEGTLLTVLSYLSNYRVLLIIIIIIRTVGVNVC